MTAPGWYKDAKDERLARWHDGSGWTEHTMVMSDWQGPGQPPPPRSPEAVWSAPVASQSRQGARADAAGAKARAKAMRPWWKRKRVIIPGALVVLIVIIAASSSGGKKDNVNTASQTTDASGSTASTAKSVNTGEHKAADDVAITSCSDASYGFVKFNVQIVNHTSKSSNYVVEVNINDADGTKAGDGLASTNNLSGGQTANIDGEGTVSDASSGPYTCVAASVSRYAS